MARSRVDKRPQAIRDLADIAVYLAEESGSDDLAFRFFDAAEASFKQLTAMPAMGVARKYRKIAMPVAPGLLRGNAKTPDCRPILHWTRIIRYRCVSFEESQVKIRSVVTNRDRSSVW